MKENFDEGVHSLLNNQKCGGISIRGELRMMGARPDNRAFPYHLFEM